MRSSSSSGNAGGSVPADLRHPHIPLPDRSSGHIQHVLERACNLRLIKRHLDRHHPATSTIEVKPGAIEPRSRRVVSRRNTARRICILASGKFPAIRALSENTECPMYKSLVALAILSVASSPVLAQPAPAQPASPSKPQMVKKRVCETTDENSYSRLGNRKVCRTIEVPAPSNTQQPERPGGSGSAGK